MIAHIRTHQTHTDTKHTNAYIHTHTAKVTAAKTKPTVVTTPKPKAATTKPQVGGSYVLKHDGHCAAGWIPASNSCQSSLKACFEQCKSKSNCGFFAYQTKCAPTNCALYSASAGCPGDGKYPAMKAYRIVRADEKMGKF